MTLDQLRIFVSVAEREHVTRAAEALHLTQSAVSGAIHALEDRHGIRLFDRVGRGIQLTEEGRIFFAEAKAILALVRNAEDTLSDLSGLRRGTLSIYASQTTASYWLPSRLAAFHAQHPAIDLKIEVGNTAQCAKAVLAGTADIGFIEGAITQPSLRTQTVARDRLVVVVGPDHPWARSQPSRPEDLLQTGWALREAGSGTRSTFEEALHSWGVSVAGLRIAMEVSSNEAICAAVQVGGLAAAVSEHVVQTGLDTGSIVALPFIFPSRDFSIIRHMDRKPSRAAQSFLEMVVGDQKEIGWV